MNNLIKFANSRAGQTLLIIGAVGAVAYMGAKQAKKVGQAVNPNSRDNIVYQGVNAVGGTITDNKRFDLGHWIYDKIHGQ